jgi:hypothetical protein
MTNEDHTVSQTYKSVFILVPGRFDLRLEESKVAVAYCMGLC